MALLIRDLVYPVTVNFQFCECKVISYISLEHSNVMVMKIIYIDHHEL